MPHKGKFTVQQKKAALKCIEVSARRVGVELYGWAVRKYLAIQAAKRRATQVQRRANRELADLQRISDVR